MSNNISQNRLAKEADSALNTIVKVKIETGKDFDPNYGKIVEALGVSVADLSKN